MPLTDPLSVFQNLLGGTTGACACGDSRVTHLDPDIVRHVLGFVPSRHDGKKLVERLVKFSDDRKTANAVAAGRKDQRSTGGKGTGAAASGQFTLPEGLPPAQALLARGMAPPAAELRYIAGMIQPMDDSADEEDLRALRASLDAAVRDVVELASEEPLNMDAVHSALSTVCGDDFLNDADDNSSLGGLLGDFGHAFGFIDADGNDEVPGDLVDEENLGTWYQARLHMKHLVAAWDEFIEEKDTLTFSAGVEDTRLWLQELGNAAESVINLLARDGGGSGIPLDDFRALKSIAEWARNFATNRGRTLLESGGARALPGISQTAKAIHKAADGIPGLKAGDCIEQELVCAWGDFERRLKAFKVPAVACRVGPCGKLEAEIVEVRQSAGDADRKADTAGTKASRAERTAEEAMGLAREIQGELGRLAASYGGKAAAAAPPGSEDKPGKKAPKKTARG